MTDLPPILDRRYHILEQVGSGVSGEVFRVEGPEGVCALKLLKATIAGMSEAERIAAFKFEFSLLKDLNHPNIVRILDFGFETNVRRFYFTEEWIEGQALKTYADQAPLQELKKLFVQALQGLAYLHNQGVLHGDIKPDNLLIDYPADREGPTLKIIDFGISHPDWVGSAGTPSFMAPEKILKEPADARADLYSLAVVFYTILTGNNPFGSENVLKTLQAQLKRMPPPATTVRPEIDPVWSELLDRMLHKRPYERPSSAAECLKFLETQGQGEWQLTGVRTLPRTWMGRPEILQEAKDFLQKVLKEKGKPALCLVGEPGLGKKTLLTELKYEAELQGIEALSLEETAQRAPSLYFLQPGDLGKIALANFCKEHAVVFAAKPSEEAALRRDLAKISTTYLHLRVLTYEEVKNFLQDLTHNQEIPPRLLNTLWKLSGGNPRILHEAAEHLMKDIGLVDVTGRWNLAVYQEVDPSLEALGLSEAALTQALEETTIEPVPRYHLLLQQTQQFALAGQLDDALAMLQKLEAQANELFSRPDRLYEHAKIFSLRGWIYTKQNRYQEARQSFASCLSLLKECDRKDPILELRTRNFLGFLEMQEGRITESINQFEDNQREAEALSEVERARIQNNELAQAYLANGEVEKAIKRLQLDLEFFESLANPGFLMKIYYNLGEAHSRLRQFGPSHLAYEKVASLARQARDWDYLIRAYNGLGNLGTLEKNFASSLDYYQRSLNLAEYLRDYLSAATVAQNRGTILSDNNRLDEALENLELSRQLLAKIPPTSNTRFLMARATLEIGEVHRKKGDAATAKNFFSEALHRSEEDANLKSFRFYPLYSLARWALEQGQKEEFHRLYPHLVHFAQGEEERALLEKLKTTTPTVSTKSGGLSLADQITLSPAETSSFLSGFFSQEALAKILRINRALLTEQDPQQLFGKILQYAAELSEAESAVLLGLSVDDRLEVLATFNTETAPTELEISQKIAQKVLREGKAVITADAQVDEGFNQFESVMTLHLRSVACFPIRSPQRIVGLLYLTHRYRPNLFSAETRRVLEAFTDQAGIALQNSGYLKEMQRLNSELSQQLANAEEEIDRLKHEVRGRLKNPYPRLLGKSPAIVDILRTLDRISDTPLSVLILGETGSGKELVARSIHENSRRRKGPFVAVNCGAIPDNLLESELFGFRSGAFTGATRDKKGLLEEAFGGTVFLDEIAELPSAMQVKILRAIQEREIRRLGDTRAIPLDVRILAATHRILDTWIAEGKFREDLYYRIAQMVITVPALRERKEDIPLLEEHFLKIGAKELGLEKVPRVERSLLAKMMDYDWPGNIRELENFLRTAVAFAEKGWITAAVLPEFLAQKVGKSSGEARPTAGITAKEEHLTPPASDFFQPQWKWEQYEAARYSQALQRHHGNAEKAAQELGVGVATVYVKIRRYGLKDRVHEGGPSFPASLTLAELKEKVVRTAYRQLQDSPYRVAKALGLNVGTVYRYVNGKNTGSAKGR